MENVEDGAKPKVKKPAVELTKKQLLNNHIVLMRKVVRQAKVHLITKLTKEAKRLKDRKGEDKAREKAKRKVERILQEIQVIKHLKPDKVSLFAIQDKSKLQDILQNSQSDTETRVLSRFSHYKLVQAEVEKYRTQNPYWELQIPVLLERSKDKRRRINKKLAEREEELLRKKKVTSPHTPVTGAKDEPASDSGGDQDSGDAEQDSISEGEGSDDFEPEEETEANVEGNSKGNKKIKKKVPLSSNKSLRSAIQVSDLRIGKSEKKAKVLKSEIKAADLRIGKFERKAKALKSAIKEADLRIGKSVGTVKVQVLKNLSDLEKTEDISSETKLFVETLSQPPKERPRSSFFVGGVEEEVEKPTNNVENKRERHRANPHKQKQPSEFKPVFKKGKLVNKGAQQRFSRDKPQAQNQRYFNNKEDNGNINFMPLGAKRENKEPTSSKKVNSSQPTDGKLHPSWEAKKRQQTVLSEFKGKKIKFADD